MGSASNKRKKKSGGKAKSVKTGAKTKTTGIRISPGKYSGRYSPLGWLVLFGPLSIILFLMLFGDSIPWLAEKSAQGAESEAEKHNSFGREHMLAGRYHEAFGNFLSALKLDPDFSEAYINISRMYYLMGKSDEAVNWLREGIAHNPPQKELAMNNLGMLYAQRGEYDPALEMFKQALTAGMKSSQVYKNIGNVHISLRQYPEAVKAYSAAIEHRPTIRDLYLEMIKQTIVDFKDNEELPWIYESAVEHLERGVTDEELAVFDAETIHDYFQHVPNLATDYKNLADALQLNNQPDEAFVNYKEALKINPQYPTAHLSLGAIYESRKEFEKALYHFEQAARLDPKLDRAKQAVRRVKAIIDS